MLLEAGAIARKEWTIVPDSSRRMDIIVYRPDGSTLWIDVSVVNPLAKTYIKHKTKSAVKMREDDKRGK